MVSFDSSCAEDLHAFDLPQVYQKPSAALLEEALGRLALEATTFSSSVTEGTRDQSHENHRLADSRGITSYLIGIVSSSLSWIRDEESKERIWDLASRRLSERSGRTAVGNITRAFTIPRRKVTSSIDDIVIKLHEPALTEDNLGFKTWSSSFALACQLENFDLSCSLENIRNKDDALSGLSIIELGAGTGLLGIAAAVVWSTKVLLTDLPEIVPNLQKNITLNESILDENSGGAECQALDWSLEPDVNDAGFDMANTDQATIILVADPIYSPEHPKILVNAIFSRLRRSKEARVVLAYPIREAYGEQIKELHELLSAIGLTLMEGREEHCRDDWADEVTCSCSLWRWT